MKHIVLSAGTIKGLIICWAPLLAWMAAIFALSSLTPATIEQATTPTRAIPGIFKEIAAHMFEYGLMAVLAYRLLGRLPLARGRRGPAQDGKALPAGSVVSRVLESRYHWLAVLALTVGYAATDELHQSFVPGRDASWLDVGYDSVGAVVGLLVAEVSVLLRRRLGGGIEAPA